MTKKELHEGIEQAIQELRRGETYLKELEKSYKNLCEDDDDLPYGWDGPMPWDEEEDEDDAPTKDDCGECALLFPIPCTKNMPQVTVKDWFAKLDEETNELKEAVLRVATLHTQIAKLKGIGRADKARIAEEGADVATVIASMEDLMDIDGDARANAQLYVNQHNKERGRW